jgi:phosphate/sulfate permease
MSEVSHSERKSMRWSAVIISSGVLLIFLQVAEQIAVDMFLGKHCGDTGVFYTGVIVILIGAALMAIISLAPRWRTPGGPASERERTTG